VSNNSVIAVIPARYGSSRFPGKPLALIAGKPMIQRVYECAREADAIDQVVVATDDDRIAAAVADFGGEAVMTSCDHQTGTDRIAEAIADCPGDIVLNVQGDEPLLPAEVLNGLVDAMKNSEADMGTVAVPFGLTGRDPGDPNAVKVVVDSEGYALYFSRALIPFDRDGSRDVEPLLHWGLYAYRREFLQRFVGWPRGRLEACEMLEQLRALENGARIMVVTTQHLGAGVDVPEDVQRVEAILREREES
jgi:3-deoxy-manno-octulosonate cytidylyltransferase (CMP-KDO synthetase)